MTHAAVVACCCFLSFKDISERNKPLPFLSPPPPSPTQTKTNKHKNHKSRKTIFLLTFWGGGGGGRVLTMEVQLYNNVGFFFSMYLLQSAGTGPTSKTDGPSKYEFFYLIKRQKPASEF